MQVEMDFLNRDVFWHLLWILPLIAILIWYANVKRQRILKLIFGGRASDQRYVVLSKGRRWIRYFMFIGAILVLLLASARPFWGNRILPFSSKGRDLMLVLDVSKSMLANDIQPTRLEHAKWFIRQLVGKSFGDRFGLIAFSGSSFLECPLTSDQTSLYHVLDEMNHESIPVGGTNIQKALETALQAFKAAESKHRAIVLITDGDELHGDSGKALEELKKMKIPLFVVGIGDPSQPGVIMMPDETGKKKFLRDAKGELVKSKLNETQLSKLAMATHGIYVRSTATSSGLTQIENKIKGLIPKEYDGGKQFRPIERFYIPLFVAIVLLMIWLAISERGAKSAKLAVSFLAILLMGNNAVANQDDAKSVPAVPKTEEVKPIDEKASEEAADEQKAEKAPDAVDLYNQGLQLQAKKGEEAKEASKYYEQAINLAMDDSRVRDRAFQNLGVLAHQDARKTLQTAPALAQKDMDGALKKIDEALKTMLQAEEMYREAMSIEAGGVETKGKKLDEPGLLEKIKSTRQIALNQQKLLNDRAKAKQLKKLIEEMKKKQQEAQKKTQEAKKQQKKENQQQKQDQKKDQKQNKQQQEQKKDQKKDQKNEQKQNQKQKQDKQDKQQQNQQQQDKQQKQDQKGQEKKEQNADQKTEDAKQAVDEMKRQAQKLQNKPIEQAAKKAEEELKKAQEAQKDKKGEKAEEHLKKALEHLDKQQKKQDKQKQDKDQKNKNKKGGENKEEQAEKDKKENDQNKDKNQDKKDKNKNDKLPEAEKRTQPQEAKKAEKDIDPKQAAALLELMANSEKELRKELKERQKQHYGVRKVDKDW